MARGVNKVILVGNLGRDPEVRHMSSGAAVANATLATSDTWKDKQAGERQERTEWHKLVFYGRLAEIAGEYLKKGSKIYAEGRLQTRKWQDVNTGVDRYVTEVVVNEMQMLDSRGGDEFKRSGDPRRNSNRPAPPPDNQPMGVQGGDDFDDDIPF